MGGSGSEGGGRGYHLDMDVRGKKAFLKRWAFGKDLKEMTIWGGESVPREKIKCEGPKQTCVCETLEGLRKG